MMLLSGTRQTGTACFMLCHLASRDSDTASIFSSRFCVASEASFHLFKKLSTSSLVSSRLAKHNVRSPSSANSRKVSMDCLVSVEF